jgi:hypothetical protein
VANVEAFKLSGFPASNARHQQLQVRRRQELLMPVLVMTT